MKKKTWIVLYFMSLSVAIAGGKTTLTTSEQIKKLAATLPLQYICNGFDPVKKEKYVGNMRITVKENHLQFNWKFNHNSETYRGSGLPSKQDPATIGVVFTNTRDSKETGLQLYHIDGNHLDGRWIRLNNDYVGFENCVPNKSSPS